MAYGLSIGVGVLIVVLGWMWTVGREIKGTVSAVKEEWQGAREQTGAALEQSGSPAVLLDMGSQVRQAFREGFQGFVQGQQALETVSGIMKEKLYEQTAETIQTD